MVNSKSDESHPDSSFERHLLCGRLEGYNGKRLLRSTENETLWLIEGGWQNTVNLPQQNLKQLSHRAASSLTIFREDIQPAATESWFLRALD